jgi:hypothetical protein
MSVNANSNDTIGNRTRNLPAYSAVPEPTEPPRVSPEYGTVMDIHRQKTVTVFPIKSWFGENYNYQANSREQGPFWEANRSSASQEFPRILWNPNVHCCIYKRPAPVCIISWTNSDCAFPSCVLKIHFNIIFLFSICVFEVAAFRQVSPPKPCIQLCSPHPSYSSCNENYAGNNWNPYVYQIILILPHF